MTHTASRSAYAIVAFGGAYALVLVVGMNEVGLSSPIVDPVLAIMEILTVVIAALLLIMMVSVYTYAPAAYKPSGLAALAFMIITVGLTCTVHFVELTAGRQLAARPGLIWPSPAYAVELLAWDVFLGLSLLFAAAVFRRRGLESAVRIGLLVSGVLCLAGASGPLTGIFRLQFIGVFGYSVALPITCALLGMLFGRWEVRAAASAASVL